MAWIQPPNRRPATKLFARLSGIGRSDDERAASFESIIKASPIGPCPMIKTVSPAENAGLLDSFEAR